VDSIHTFCYFVPTFLTHCLRAGDKRASWRLFLACVMGEILCFLVSGIKDVGEDACKYRYDFLLASVPGKVRQAQGCV
jgi:hypothetical protein